MPLGQKVKVCGRRYGRTPASKKSNPRHVDPKDFEGVKPYRVDEARSSDAWKPEAHGDDDEVWCGLFSRHSAWVFLCESCAVENGLKW